MYDIPGIAQGARQQEAQRSMSYVYIRELLHAGSIDPRTPAWSRVLLVLLNT